MVMSREGLRSLIDPFLDMEVHQLEEHPNHINERYQQVEKAEKLYQKFYNGKFHLKNRWHKMYHINLPQYVKPWQTYLEQIDDSNEKVRLNNKLTAFKGTFLKRISFGT